MIACIRIGYFAATIEARNLTDAADSPLLVAGYTGKRGKIRAACQLAEGAGVQVGMPVGQALALCPEARAVMFTAPRYQRALLSLMDTLTHFSQWVEADRRSFQSATIYVDLGKLRPREGWELARLIIDKLQTEHNHTASIGLAVSKFPALAAACDVEIGGIRLIPYGEEKTYLAPFPVALLPLDKETARRLKLYGLRTLGQLASLPRPALIEQFGKPGGTIHRLASGEDSRRIAQHQPEAIEAAEGHFDPPLDNRILLENNLSRMVAELTVRLQANNLTCSKVTLMLQLENHACLEADTHLRDPLSVSLDLYRRSIALLNQLHPVCGVTSFKVEFSRLEPVLPRQLSLFDQSDQPDLRESIIDLAERYIDAYFYTVEVNESPSLIAERSFHLQSLSVA